MSELVDQRERFGRYAEIVCLSIDGAPVDPAEGRGEDPVLESDPETARRSLTGMRRHLMRQVDAHLILGGRRGGFLGTLPGLVEETLLALKADLPVYPAAGYGGVTADIAGALGVDGAPDIQGPSDATPPDPRLLDGLGQLRQFTASPDWTGLRNGLTADENERLAGTRSPGEIAELASLGLERLRRGT